MPVCIGVQTPRPHGGWHALRTPLFNGHSRWLPVQLLLSKYTSTDVSAVSLLLSSQFTGHQPPIVDRGCRPTHQTWDAQLHKVHAPAHWQRLSLERPLVLGQSHPGRSSGRPSAHQSARCSGELVEKEVLHMQALLSST